MSDGSSPTTSPPQASSTSTAENSTPLSNSETPTPPTSTTTTTTTTSKLEKKNPDDEDIQNVSTQLSELQTKDENSPSDQTKGKEKELEEEPEERDGPLMVGIIDPRLVSEIQIEQSDPNSPLFSASSFEDLKLEKELLDGIIAKGYKRPSAIQEKALPILLSNPPRHMIAQAQSGTGKTAAFSLAMLHRANTNEPYPQALCVSPTRELARQTAQVVKELGQYKPNLSVHVAIPDRSGRRDKRPVKAQIVIGTPGKILELIHYKLIRSERIRILVFDEADQMLDRVNSNFGEDSIRIKMACGQKAQIVCFSATYSPSVLKFCEQVVPKPNEKIILRIEKLSLEKIQQYYIKSPPGSDKFSVLSDIYGSISISQSIIFVQHKHTAMNLYEAMRREGHTISMISADLQPEQRDNIIDEYRSGKTKVLIATNVIARGIDISQVTLIINYDIPVTRTGQADAETYLHRVGRSGRFGRHGIAFNFVDSEKSLALVRDIARTLGRQIPEFEFERLSELPDIIKSLI